MNTRLEPHAYRRVPARLLPSSVSTRNFRKDYLPFTFPGFLGEGSCFLRVDTRAGDAGTGKYTVVCSQLRSHQGTSMTSAVDSILCSLVSRLLQEHDTGGAPVIEIANRFDFFHRLIHTPSSRTQHLRRIAIDHFHRNCLWIEHYPAGDGRFQHESWAVISFHSSGAPCWSYQSKASLQQKIGDAAFLTMDRARIETCLSNTMPSN